jgi:hypothetical protein
MADDELTNLAARAYVYGFPLVFNLEQVTRLVVSGIGSVPPTPFNTFSHARTLADPQATFVSINNDTLYSMAPLDLGTGPLLLTVPPVGDRYFVLQFIDAWTDNFAYIGTRATGSDGGRFLLVPPGWEGEPTVDDAVVIRIPSRVAIIIGRWACDGVDDLPAVHALQDALELTPLLETLTAPQGVPVVADLGSPALTFFERYRVWSQAFPPAERDAAAQASFAPLGLAGADSVADAPADVVDALEAGYVAGRKTLDDLLHSDSSPFVNGWSLTMHVFDYNLDYFEVGTIDAPQWRIEDPQTRVAVRASAALAGLWGNHGYEAVYIMTYVDAAGDALSGDHVYTLTLSPTPPVDAFWSLTMYSLPDFFLVQNELGRYSVGDRTPGIVYDDDGGLTITISRTRPSDAKAAANWLPAPEGEFRPILRMYAPRPAVFDLTYSVPAIVKIG